MVLTKTAEDSTTITLSWTPPANADYYVFYSSGGRVTNAPAIDKNGNVKKSIKFSKAGGPYEVVCLRRYPYAVDIGQYPENIAVSKPSEVVS